MTYLTREIRVLDEQAWEVFDSADPGLRIGPPIFELSGAQAVADGLQDGTITPAELDQVTPTGEPPKRHPIREVVDEPAWQVFDSEDHEWRIGFATRDDAVGFADGLNRLFDRRATRFVVAQSDEFSDGLKRRADVQRPEQERAAATKTETARVQNRWRAVFLDGANTTPKFNVAAIRTTNVTKPNGWFGYLRAYCGLTRRD